MFGGLKKKITESILYRRTVTSLSKLVSPFVYIIGLVYGAIRTQFETQIDKVVSTIFLVVFYGVVLHLLMTIFNLPSVVSLIFIGFLLYRKPF